MLETQSSVNDSMRQSLIDWRQDDNKLGKNALTRWHKGQVCTRLPDKDQLNALQMDAIGQGWMPKEAFITPDSRVVAIGSCFAGYFILWLADHGFNKNTVKSPYNALLRFGSEFENAAVIAQQFRWAFGELDDKSLLWIDKNKDIFEATEERRLLVRETLINTDVLLVTLGLSEVWYDRDTGEPMWRAITSDQFDPKKHIFKVESMEQTLSWLNTIERIREKYIPNMKIIFTISPVRFTASFRPVSAFTANNASKAILRAALDEFLRGQAKKLNIDLFYFPSYEFVTEYFINSFEHDNRHVSPTVVENIIYYFVSYYCSATMIEKSAKLSNFSSNNSLQKQLVVQTPTDELLGRIASLENKVFELQKICDERLAVIVELDKAIKTKHSDNKQDSRLQKFAFYFGKLLRKFG